MLHVRALLTIALFVCFTNNTGAQEKSTSELLLKSLLALEKLSEQNSAIGIRLDNLENEMRELRRIVEDMRKSRGYQLAEKTDLLTDNDKAALRVRQVAKPANDNVPGIDKKYYALTFSLDVDKDKADLPKSRIIAHVEKVEYAFDERWFKPPIRTSTNKWQDFNYTMRVWGVTKVKAAIYLTNPREILFREGYMKLRETTFLESTAN